MALFTFKKKEAPKETPTAQVLAMRGQGMSNPQIIQKLGEQGYSQPQIFDALNQADIKSEVEAPMEGGTMQEDYPTEMPSYGQPVMQTAAPAMSDAAMKEKISEIAEAIIEEKWTDLVTNVGRIADWKDKTEARLASIETQISGLRNDFDKLHSALLEKISDYERGITDVGTEIKALEKVFQKILPGFVDNVQELSRITSTMRTVSSKKK